MTSKKKPEDITTILVTVATREKLRRVGYKGETYDSIINRLLDKS